jgi:molybdopterin biosynthesis enzyme MoaB
MKELELTLTEKKIVEAMREVDKLFKKYKKERNSNHLLLFCGGTGCSLRAGTPSADAEVVGFSNITCDGGDGGDIFG